MRTELGVYVAGLCVCIECAQVTDSSKTKVRGIGDRKNVTYGRNQGETKLT
jgi:hypothetical protein